jgi:DNA polymerase III gamma/tau subunit
MKKIVSIFVSAAFMLSLMVMPAFADKKTTTPGGTTIKGNGIYEKQLKALQNNLTKTNKLLVNATNDKKKLEATILKAIEKAQDKDSKKTEDQNKQVKNATTQVEKWQEELDKAVAHDKIELANLEKDIQKWTEMKSSQIAALNKQIATIEATLAKKLAELATKTTAAKDDATKLTLTTTKANLQNYADQKKAAITNYLTALNSIWADRQKVWAERKEILQKRQASDLAFRTAMFNIRKAELSDKLVTIVQPTPTNKTELAVRASYQKKVAALDAKITKYTNQIKELQDQIAKLKK